MRFSRLARSWPWRSPWRPAPGRATGAPGSRPPPHSRAAGPGPGAGPDPAAPSGPLTLERAITLASAQPEPPGRS